MADDVRNVAVNLTMQIAGYMANSQKVRAENRATMTESAKLKAQVDAQRQSVETLGHGAAAAALVFTGAFVAMVKSSADFEERMSQVQALSKATTTQMGQLRNAAFTTGQAFGLSATQVADAQIELTKAGVGVKEIVGGALPGALALAAAGQLDVGKATAIATTAMTQFKLTGSDVPHVADLLAAGADKSIASVDSLGDSLVQSGQVAAQFGLSVEDTVGTLTAFSKAGLNGSDAGTSFKTMLTQLASPTQQAQELLAKYNITTYDTQGRFVGITALADNLQKGLGNLSQQQRNAALSTIFGNDAIRASGALYELGGKKLQGFIDGNNEAGFATEQAAKKLDNLNGDLAKFNAALQNDLIRSGSGANTVLRELTKGATGFLGTIGDLPAPLLAVGGGLTAAAAGITLTGAAALIAVPKMVAFDQAMTDAGFKVTPFSSALKGGRTALGGFRNAAGSAASFLTGPWGIGLAAGGAAVAGLEEYLKSLQSTSDEVQSSLTGASTGVDVLRIAAKGLGASTFGDETKSIKDFSSNISRLSSLRTQGIIGNVQIASSNDLLLTRSAVEKVGQTLATVAQTNLPEAQRGFSLLAKETDGSKASIATLLSFMPGYESAVRSQLLSQGKLNGTLTEGQIANIVLAAAQNSAGESAKGQAGAVRGLTTDLTVAFAAQNKLAKSSQDFVASEDAALEAIQQVRAALKDNSGTLDQNTSKGRANRAATLQAVQAIQAHAAAINADGKHADEASIYTDKMAVSLVNTLESFGVSSKAAEQYVGKLLGIPKNVTTRAQLKADQLKIEIAKIREAMSNIDGLTAQVYIKGRTVGLTDSQASQVARNARFAEGGPIDGAGPKGVDSELIWAAPGEHMVTAREVDAAGGQGAMYRIRAAMLTGQLRGFAKGGAIGNAIGEATGDANSADRRADALDRQIAKAKKDLATAKKRAAAADRAADRASDASSSIYGKGTGAKKHNAAQTARELKKRADAAAKSVNNLEKRIDSLSKSRDDYRSKQADANARAATLREGREDFQSAITRGSNDNNPTSLVDQLRSMSRDSNYTKARRKTFQDAANDADESLAKFAKQAENAKKKVDDATSSLNDLTSASQQMASSITSTIAGEFRASSAVTTTQDQTVTRQAGNLTYSAIVKGGSSVTGSGLSLFYRNSRGTAESFAADLEALAGKVDPRLLAEIAGYGVETGAPLAKALLTATSAQLSSINADYSGLQAAAGRAGQTVADANYKQLIATAQAQLDAANAGAQQITDAINAKAADLEKIIGRAFGLKGYKTGAWLTPGSPDEIAGFVHGQETVLNQRQSLAYRNAMRRQDADLRSYSSPLSGVGASGGRSGVTVQPVPVRLELAFADTQLAAMVDARIVENDRAAAVELAVI